MNLVDCHVTKILSTPKEQTIIIENGIKFTLWYVDVEYSSWGRDNITSIPFETKIDAENLKIGHTFLQ